MRKQYVGNLEFKGKEENGEPFLIRLINAVVEIDVDPHSEDEFKGTIVSYTSSFYAKTED